MSSLSQPARVLLLSAALIAVGVRAQTTDRNRNFGDIALGRTITATSTCGLNGRQQYCVVASLGTEKCFDCDATNPLEAHPASLMVDPEPAEKSTWWQSENGVHNVTVQLDFETKFTFTHLVLTFQSFRPKSMVLQRSTDFGQTWTDYQYFSSDCRGMYDMADKSPNERVTLKEVICTSEYSDLEPSTGGEVVFSTVPHSVSIIDPYDEEVIERLSVTNLRIRLDMLNTLGDDLLDPRPDVLRKYYYAIYDWNVHGRCSCNGHADSCVAVENIRFSPELQTIMIHGQCECTGNTVGLNCEECKPLYNNRKWKPQQSCEQCECYGHADSCRFDAAVYEANGKKDGGVCMSCRDNTAGNKCEQCAHGYYPRPGKLFTDKDRCDRCDCDSAGIHGNGHCAQESDSIQGVVLGDCQCKRNVVKQKCGECRAGTWNLSASNPDGCQECDCYTGGTLDGSASCHLQTGQCFCKMYVTGRRCDECKPGYYMMRRLNPRGCENCDCDPGGALDHRCNQLTGTCVCRSNIHRRRCTAVWPGYFFQNLDYLLYEAEYMTLENGADPIHRIRISDDAVTWTGHGFAKVSTGSRLSFMFSNISMTMPYEFLIRYESQSTSPVSQVMVTVTHIPGVNGYNIDPLGHLSRCNLVEAGHILQFLVKLKKANGASHVVYVDPICLFAKETYRVDMSFQMMNSGAGSTLIDSIVLLPTTDSVGILNDLALQQQWEDADCYNRRLQVSPNGARSEVCERLMFSISAIINNGSIPCECNANGSTSPICLPFEGQCNCKPGVIGRRCDVCAPGHYAMSGFGCAACNCEVTGSKSLFCDDQTGQCPCLDGRSGPRCDNCEQYSYYNRHTGRCMPCGCDKNGSATLECGTNINGSCSCKPGVGGHKCTECLPGHYNFSQSGCIACGCSSLSSVDSQCDSSGQCECKEGATGKACDQCKPNTFDNLNIDSGCQSCFCNGFSSSCMSAPGWYLHSKVSNFAMRFDFDGWRADSGRVTWETGEFLLAEPLGSAPSVSWMAPPEFLGDMRTAYTQQLQFALRQPAGIPADSDPLVAYVFLHRRRDPSAKLYHVLNPPPSESWTLYTISLMSTEWSRGKMNGNTPHTTELRKLLADIAELRITTMYPSGFPGQLKQQALDQVRLTYAAEDNSTSDVATHVEECTCPDGRIGRTCAWCAEGWTRDPPNSGEFSACVRCFCWGHSDMCHPETGVCINCMDNTHGDKCDTCQPGYYGDAMLGTCKPCPCPGGTSGNKFADSCVKSESSGCPDGIRCNCEPGYVGCRCDQCALGYYGQPRIPGGRCNNCSCTNNGPPGDLENCDKVTGICKVCLYNTTGDQCNECIDGFHGDASKRECRPCDCDPLGSLHGNCDPFNGRCHCNPNVVGDRCDQCADDHWGFSRGLGCVPCLCCPGSVNSQCDMETGRCECRPNTGGDDDPRCCFCKTGFWNYSTTGCRACDCDRQGSEEGVCDPETGTCLCKLNVLGPRCDKCRDGTSGILPYCEPCGECYETWLVEVERVRAEVVNLTNKAKAITQHGSLGEYEEELQEMERKLNEAERIIREGADSPDRVVMSQEKLESVELKLGAIRGRLRLLNDRLENTSRRNDVVSSDLDNLENTLKMAEDNITAIKEEADMINGTSVDTVIKEIRAAGEKSRRAADRVNATRDVVNKANGLKDSSAGLVGPKFVDQQNENRAQLSNAQSDLMRFDDLIRKTNEEVCGQTGDDCQTCGGIGCGGVCGGSGCSGAVNRTQIAEQNARQARTQVEAKLKQSETIIKQLDVARHTSNQAQVNATLAVTRAKEAEKVASDVYRNASLLLDRLLQFQMGDRANPEDIRREVDAVFGINHLPVDQMQMLVNETRQLLDGIDPALVENADLYSQLHANVSAVCEDAKDAGVQAEFTVNDTDEIEKILSQAAMHQDAAASNISTAEPNVMMANETSKKAFAKTMEASSVSTRVRAQITQIGRGAEDVRDRASDNRGDKLPNAETAVRIAQSALNNVQDDIDELKLDLTRFLGNLDMASSEAQAAISRANESKKKADDLLVQVQGDQTQLLAFERRVNENNATITNLEGTAERLSNTIDNLLRDITRKADHHASCQPPA